MVKLLVDGRWQLFRLNTDWKLAVIEDIAVQRIVHLDARAGRKCRRENFFEKDGSGVSRVGSALQTFSVSPVLTVTSASQ
jgi:hypothetical protein